ncbi:MAG: TolC family protein [Candidatus Sumerlaeota bacterium]|nr:TolC family protein [Candidatus Sumerlaeota bacterium]
MRFLFPRISHFVPLLISGLICLALAGCATPPARMEWKPLQASELATTLTLSQCLNLARNSDVRAAEWRSRIVAAHAGVVTAKEIPNPTLNLAWEDVGMRDAAGASLASHLVGVSYPIFFWWTRDPKIRSAQAAEREEIQSVRSERRQLDVSVGTAYWELVADQRQVALAGQLVENAREAARLARKEKELGSRSLLDVHRAEADLLEAESDQSDAVSKLRLDQLAFAFALGTEQPAFPQVSDCGDESLTSGSHALTASSMPYEILAAALRKDPDWAKAKAACETAQADLQIERLSALPLTDAQAGAGRKGGPDGIGANYGLDVPIPIFNANLGGIQKAQAALETAQADEEKARRAVVATVSQAWEKARIALRKYRQYAVVLADARQRDEAAARKLFTAGEIGYEDYLLVNRDAIQKRKALIESWLGAAQSVWNFECALGWHDSERQ